MTGARSPWSRWALEKVDVVKDLVQSGRALGARSDDGIVGCIEGLLLSSAHEAIDFLQCFTKEPNIKSIQGKHHIHQ